MIFGFNSEEGILNTAEYIKHNDKFHQFNQDWDYYGPRKIFDTDNATPEEVELARKENLINFLLKVLKLTSQAFFDTLLPYCQLLFFMWNMKKSCNRSGKGI